MGEFTFIFQDDIYIIFKEADLYESKFYKTILDTYAGWILNFRDDMRLKSTQEKVNIGVTLSSELNESVLKLMRRTDLTYDEMASILRSYCTFLSTHTGFNGLIWLKRPRITVNGIMSGQAEEIMHSHVFNSSRFNDLDFLQLLDDLNMNPLLVNSI